ncbi:hypothetical protein H2O64_10190 [Kordia sp. YSTF-M3]|uniref:Receptor L-domain domain-containing protein n=1 Tax=Kordia aestuariivivens TaxID=2759037 RepID=A0ABR7Q909_9FLAO|nr:hypothetical protein [Kordia aestuariivivens]MBC8755042.1 hypothetical protein [Kordia aestuariivivens]
MKKILLFTMLLSILVSCTSDNNVQPAPILVFQGDLILRSQADVVAYGAQGYNVINGYLNIGDRSSDDQPIIPSDITDLSPLSSIIQVTKQIEIQSNPLLTSLSGLENLASVAGIVINSNDNMTSLNGLEGITTITDAPFPTGQVQLSGGVIAIFDNPSLASMEALGNITPQTLQQVSINDNGVTSLDGLESITSISSLGIVNNDALTSLDALQGLVTIESAIYIAGNDNLTNYCILQAPLQSNTSLSIFNVLNNQFNPTQQNIIDGNCSQ